MKHRIIAIVAGAALGLYLTAAPALAADRGVAAPSATNPGLGHDCPGIVFGDGVYYDGSWPPLAEFPPDPNLTGSTTFARFRIEVGDLATDLATASCRQAWYTIAFLPTDAAGTVLSDIPAFRLIWKGDGVTNDYTATHYFTTDPPQGLCVYATSQVGANVIHYAPSDDPSVRCAWLDLNPSSNPGRGFRG